jgi:carboxypeptidase PM20D1
VKRVLGVIVAVLAVLTLVVVVRTLSLSPGDAQVSPIEPRAVDLEGAATRLGEGLRFETISLGRDEPVPSDAFYALHDHLRRSYPRSHEALEREIVSGYSLLYTWPGRNEKLDPALLMAHQDVVPVDAGSWEQPPFSGKIVDGILWGRGAIDDKGALYAIMEAVELLLAEGFVPERTILIFFGHDEELGGPRGAAKAAELLAERGVSLAWVLDEGGFIVEGMVPGVEKPIALVGIAEKGSVTFDLTLEMPGGHSSVPPRHSGIGVMAAAVTKLEANRVPGGLDDLTRSFLESIAPELPFAVRAALSNLWLFGGLVEAGMAATPALDAMQRTTTAVTVMNGGVKSNVLPSEVRAKMNFRIRPGDTVATVREHVVETIADDRIEVSHSVGREASPVSRTDSAAFAHLSRTVAEVFPGVAVVPYTVVGGTDSRYFYPLTQNVYRLNPFRFGRESVTLPHGTNERVAVESLSDAIRFYARLISTSESSPDD